MIGILIITHALLGMEYSPLDARTIKALEEHGLSTSEKDFSKAIERAFLTSDKELFFALSKSFLRANCARGQEDLILNLFTKSQDTEFKEAIEIVMACPLSVNERVAQSKWGSEFYKKAVEIIRDPKPNIYRPEASMCLDNLAMRCGLSVTPHCVRTLLTIPDNPYDWIAASGCLFMLDFQKAVVTPTTAYYISLKFKGKEQGYEKYLRRHNDLAQLFLSGAEPPPKESLEEVIKQLDVLIDENGKALFDRYGKAELQPPPPPPSEYRYLSMQQDRFGNAKDNR